MTDSWFDPTFYAWFGALAGGVGGTLAGVFAGVSVYLVRRNQGRWLVLGGCIFFILLGALVLSYGIAALVTGQPHRIWWGPIYGGAAVIVACSITIRVMRKRYAQAEQLLQSGPGRLPGSTA